MRAVVLTALMMVSGQIYAGEVIEWVCLECHSFSTLGGKFDAARFASNVTWGGGWDTSNSNGNGVVRDGDGDSLSPLFAGKNVSFTIKDSSDNVALVSFNINGGQALMINYIGGTTVTITVQVNGIVAQVNLRVEKGKTFVYDGSTGSYEYVGDVFDMDADTLLGIVFSFAPAFLEVELHNNNGKPKVIVGPSYQVALSTFAAPMPYIANNCASCGESNNQQ